MEERQSRRCSCCCCRCVGRYCLSYGAGMQGDPPRRIQRMEDQGIGGFHHHPHLHPVALPTAASRRSIQQQVRAGLQRHRLCTRGWPGSQGYRTGLNIRHNVIFTFKSGIWGPIWRTCYPYAPFLFTFVFIFFCFFFFFVCACK